MDRYVEQVGADVSDVARDGESGGVDLRDIVVKDGVADARIRVGTISPVFGGAGRAALVGGGLVGSEVGGEDGRVVPGIEECDVDPGAVGAGGERAGELALERDGSDGLECGGVEDTDDAILGAGDKGFPGGEDDVGMARPGR